MTDAQKQEIRPLSTEGEQLVPLMASAATDRGMLHAGDLDGRFKPLQSAKVMMVDDEPITSDILQAFLEDAGYRNFLLTSDPSKVLDLLIEHRPNVLLLDLMMPKVNGFDILKAMRADSRLCFIPVIVLTSSSDAETKLKALELGATDFLAKPVDSSELALRLRNTLAAKAYQDQLAYSDSLTGLPNRQMLADHIDWALRQAERYGRTGALLHLNVDRFKQVNEALGPAMGDEVLRIIAGRLGQVVRTSDTFGRTGEELTHNSLSRLAGDEFTVLLVEMEKIESAINVAQRLLDSMKEPLRVGGYDLFVTLSIGIAVFPADGANRDALQKNAAAALESVKKKGGNSYQFYSNSLNERSLQFLNLQNDLRKAIERGEFRLYFQPKLDVSSERIVGAEALIRWEHPKRGMVWPGEFIPMAEQTGLIVPIGTWVFHESCRQIKRWQAAGLEIGNLSVNVSGRQFHEENFLDVFQNILGETGIDPKLIKIELTESMLMEDASRSVNVLQQIKRMGLQLSIDDFGTGYSSLSYLQKFPIDELKIDYSFMKGINAENSQDSTAIVGAIIALAHSLGLKVVAEGVESDHQLVYLQERGCEECQGFMFSKPLPADKFASLLVDRTRKFRGLG